MALDPRISLLVQPPQITAQAMTPFQLAGGALSLQNMMRQGAMSDIELQQQRLALQQAQAVAEERRRMVEYFSNPPQAAQVQPPPVSMSPAPAPGVVAPGAVPPITAAAPAPPSQTLADIMTTPPAPPPPTAPVAPQTVAPAPQAAPPASAAIVPTRTQANEWSFAGGLDPTEFQRRFPLTGPGIVKTYYDSIEAALKAKHQQWQTQTDRIDRMAGYAQGIIPGRQDTVTAAVGKALASGDITPEQARTLINVPSNDPSWGSWVKQNLESKDYLKNQIDEAKLGMDKAAEERTKALFGPQLSKAFDDAAQSALTTQDKQRVQDAHALFGAYSQSKAAGDQLRDSLPIGRRAYFMNVATPLDALKRGLSPQEYVGEYDKSLKTLMDAAELGLKKQKEAREENIYQQTYGAGANQALTGVEARLRVPATKEAQKAGDEYLKAMEVADQMQSFINLARSGNKAAGSNLPLVGVETINAINGIKRINKDEIAQYQGAGSLLDKIVGKVEKLAVGQPIPSDVLADIETMHNTLRSNAETGYGARLNGINQNYHSNFQPVKRPGAQGPTPSEVQSGGAGTYHFDDGSVWVKNPDGTIRKTK